LRKLVAALCVIAAIVFFVLAAMEYYPYIESERNYKEIQKRFVTDTNEDDADESVETEDTENPEDALIDINFEALLDEYSDAIGWIYVPGTHINYPIMKGSDDTFYLNHDPAGNYNKLGSIFVPANTPDSMNAAHTVIYGHNMRSGRMFGDLSDYASESFRDNYPYIYLYTPEGMRVCAVYNAYTCTGGDDNYRIEMDIGTEEYAEWITQSLEPLSYKVQKVKFNEQVQTVTLSTCTDSGSIRNRFVVHCAVIEKNP